ncbi:MAG TPA: head GIN domain-containing protein [Lunatimonas sp.]|nr:head GIN domain-containing protein [Lunatimonas sp.]
MKVFKSFIWCCYILMVASTSASYAQTVEESRALAAFNSIQVSSGIDATLIKGDTHGIEITASGVELSKVESKVTNRVLELKIPGISPKASTVKAIITYVSIEEISASTSAKVFIKDPITEKAVKLFAATSSYIEAEVNAQDLLLDAQTNAKIFVTGKATNLDFSAYTNAEIDGEKLVTDNATVRINTNAKGSFHVNESIKGTAATRGRVVYTGDPNIVDIKTNTGGSINEK